MPNIINVVTPLADISERKVRTVQRIKPVPRQHDHEQPVDTEHLPQLAAHPKERRIAQRRTSNQSILMDRRSGLERRHFYSPRHINEEA